MNDIYENIIKVPENFRYNEDHIWMEYTDRGYIRCGVTEYLCEKMGEIISLEYTRNIRNMELNPGETVLVIESLKDSVSIRTPVAGTIVEINVNCVESPDIVNGDPYDEGWLFVISTDDIYDYEHQLQSDEYEYIVMKEKEDLAS